MGKRAKRREAARLLKQHGFGRLYRGNKKSAWRWYRSGKLNRLIWILGLKPGDAIHDCDGFNHEFSGKFDHFYEEWFGAGPPIRVHTIDQVGMTDGRWSCGCPGSPEPARPREWMEGYWKGWLIHDFDQVRHWGWLGGSEELARERLMSGDHIFDERGILLPEFQRKV